MWKGHGSRGLDWGVAICSCLRFHWEHHVCLVSQEYLLSARQWLPVPAELPELREPGLAVFQRRATSAPRDAAASRAELGSPSLTAACSSRKPSKEEDILKEETTLCISNEYRRWPQMPRGLQVSWMLFSALCKSSVGAFMPNEPSSPLPLFFTPGKHLCFLFPWRPFFLSQTWHQSMWYHVQVVCAPRAVGLLEMSPSDDGGTRSPQRLFRHLLGRCQPTGKGLESPLGWPSSPAVIYPSSCPLPFLFLIYFCKLFTSSSHWSIWSPPGCVLLLVPSVLWGREENQLQSME